MSKFKIFDPQEQLIAEGCPRYTSTFGQPDCIEFPSISSPSPIGFSVGCYVDYYPGDSGLGYPNRYTMYTLPQVTKQAYGEKSGDAFVYSNLQFHAPTKMLERTLFRDIVMFDNEIHFSTRESISTYEPVSGIAARIQACMNANNVGEQWHIITEETTDEDLASLLTDVRSFSVNAGVSCIDVLNEIYNIWKGIGWVYEKRADGHYIILGRPNLQTVDNTTGAFLYGKGNGLKMIKKSISSAEGFATRLYAYGSTRNLPSRYYNNKQILNRESVDIPNLMLPISRWGRTDGHPDARKAFVEDSEAIEKYGNIEKVLYFDGNGNNKEIYPSLEEVTVGDIRHFMSPLNKYYPKGAFYDDSERVDELLSGSSVADDGIYMDTGSGSDVFASGEYIDLTPQISFSVKGPGTQIPVQELISSLTLGTIPGTGKFLLRGKGWNYHITSNEFGIDLQAIVVLKLNKGTDNITLMTIPVPLVNREDGSADVYFFDDFSKVYSVKYSQSGIVTAELYLYGDITTMSASVKYTLTAISAPEHKIDWRCMYDLAETFSVVTKQIGFDLSQQASTASNGIGTINMKSGKCAGREFAIKSCEYNVDVDGWVLTCYRQNDTDISQYFPNSVYQIEANDRFVLTDISMPNIYVQTAELRLYTEAQRMLAIMSKPKYVYEPEVDSVFQSEVKEYLTSGRYMTLVDADIIDGGTDYILIDSVTITYGESNLPSIRITLRDEKASSFFQKTFRQQKQTESNVTSIKTQMENVSVGVVTKGESGQDTPTVAGVTSVGISSSALGLRAVGGPITSSGTFILSFDKGYSLLTDAEKEKIKGIPQKVSDLTNDVGYIEKTEADAWYAKKENESLLIDPDDVNYEDYDSVDRAIDTYANVFVRVDDGIYSTYTFSERNDDDRVIYFTRVTRNLQMSRIYINDDGWHI